MTEREITVRRVGRELMMWCCGDYASLRRMDVPPEQMDEFMDRLFDQPRARFISRDGCLVVLFRQTETTPRIEIIMHQMTPLVHDMMNHMIATEDERDARASFMAELMKECIAINARAPPELKRDLPLVCEIAELALEHK